MNRYEELTWALQEVGVRGLITQEVAAFFAALLDTQYDGIALLNNEPRILYVNKSSKASWEYRERK